MTWPDVPEVERQDERDGLHWKTRTLVALLHRVNPRSGVTEADYRALKEWLRGVIATPPSNGAN